LANFQYSSRGMGVLNNLSTTRRFYLCIWTRINIKKRSREFRFAGELILVFSIPTGKGGKISIWMKELCRSNVVHADG